MWSVGTHSLDNLKLWLIEVFIVPSQCIDLGHACFLLLCQQSTFHATEIDPGPSGYWRYHNSFFPNGKPGKMTEPVCVAKRLASTGSEGKKIELSFFFFLPLAKDLGAFDVQSAGI